MRLRLGFYALFAYVLLALCPLASAAKGVIKQPNGGGMSGLMIIISLDPSDARLPNAQVGDTVPFTEPVADAGKADLINALIAVNPVGQPVATRIVKLTTGIVIDSPVNGSITVDSGQSVLITNGATIDGKITVNGGFLIVLNNSKIDGKIEAADDSFIYLENSTAGSIKVPPPAAGSNVQIVIDGTHIEGKIESNGAALLKVTRSTIDGSVKSDGDGRVIIANNTINGNLSVLGTVSPTITGNIVGGITRIQ